VEGLRIPERLGWLRGSAAGREWLAGLPATLAGCVARWSLRVAEPYPYSYVSLVLPATLPDGTEAVLKLQFPDPDSTHEAAALRLWDGDGAVRLLAHDESRLALLIERCVPGNPLSEVAPEQALTALVGLLPRLWRPAGEPFAAGSDQARYWAEELAPRWEQAGRPCERRLVDAATGTLRELAGSQGEQLLLNQDLHVNNVLRARREPWLVIDPKPLVGERELAVAALVRDFGLGHGRAEVQHRLDRLTAELGADRERSRGWSFAYAVVWAFLDEEGRTRHVETARWLLPAPPVSRPAGQGPGQRP
jgi:streptomycin 6-kinase